MVQITFFLYSLLLKIAHEASRSGCELVHTIFSLLISSNILVVLFKNQFQQLLLKNYHLYLTNIYYHY